jgi:hypothetical protein
MEGFGSPFIIMKGSINMDKKELVIDENIVTADNKWGKIGQGVYLDEKFVEFTIPKDRINPRKTIWIGCNGDEAYLATGKKIRVPESVKANWEWAYNKTIEAEESMSQEIEIG